VHSTEAPEDASEPCATSTVATASKRCYTPEWLLQLDHEQCGQLQQHDATPAFEELRHSVGEDFWAPNWQNTVSQQYTFQQAGSSQAEPLQRQPPQTPSSSPPSEAIAPPVDVARIDKGKGVLQLHGTMPTSNDVPAAAIGQPGRAAKSFKVSLEDIAMTEPFQITGVNGMVTPIFKKVGPLSIVL